MYVCMYICMYVCVRLDWLALDGWKEECVLFNVYFMYGCGLSLFCGGIITVVVWWWMKLM